MAAVQAERYLHEFQKQAMELDQARRDIRAERIRLEMEAVELEKAVESLRSSFEYFHKTVTKIIGDRKQGA